MTIMGDLLTLWVLAEQLQTSIKDVERLGLFNTGDK